MSDAETLTTRLLLVRHGESRATVERRLAGVATCTGLSDLGIRQAERLRDRLASGHEPRVDALWASPVARARQTAEILNQHLGLPVQIDDELEEHRPGAADGRLFDEIEADLGPFPRDLPVHALWLPGSESAASFHHRVGLALHQLVETNPGRTVLVACHGGVIDVAFRTFLHLPIRGLFDLWTLNTAVTEFAATHGADHLPVRWRLVRYNDHAHLAGLPLETEVAS